MVRHPAPDRLEDVPVNDIVEVGRRCRPYRVKEIAEKIGTVLLNLLDGGTNGRKAAEPRQPGDKTHCKSGKSAGWRLLAPVFSGHCHTGSGAFCGTGGNVRCGL
jgi:hypothetical protein